MITDIPIKQLRESPTNPRKTYGDLDELAESVRNLGVLQPILVRKKGKHFEIVFGSRRFRAAKVAKLTTVPAMVREMNDLQVREAQIVENCHREDVHPLEEADAYRVLHEEHGYAVEDLAAKVGKSKAYVYGRMKLCRLCDEGREAYLAGKLTASTALYVARIPDPKLQAKAAQDIAGGEEAMSARQASWIIQQRYMLRLKGAPFKTDAADLVPDAGPCTTCPKRTGNQLEIFEDVGSADVCTDPPCFRAKSDAAWAAKAERYRKKGLEVLDGKKSEKLFYGGGYGHTQDDVLRPGCGYVALRDRPWEDPEGRTYGQLLGKNAATAVARAPNGKAVQLIPSKGLKKALKEAGHDLEALRRQKTEQQMEEHEEELAAEDPEYAERRRAREEERRQREARKAAERRAVACMVEAAEKGVGVNRRNFWREIAMMVAGDDWMLDEIPRRRGWSEGVMEVEEVREKIRAMSDNACRGLVVEWLVGVALCWAYGDARTGVLEDACRLFQVDIEDLEQEAAAELAGDAAEGDAASDQGKTPDA